jgi:hypothetical protein
VYIHHARDQVVIDVRLLSGQQFGHINAFFFRLVRQHCTAHDIADRVNVRNGCLQVVVHFDLPAVIRSKADVFQAEAFRVGFAPDGNEAVIAFDRDRFLLFVDSGHLYALAGIFYFLNARFEVELKAFFLQDLDEFFTETAVHRREDRIGEFHHFDLRA